MASTIYKADNGVWHYDDGIKKYTQEEADEINRKEMEKEKSFIPQILEDGFIDFPVFFEHPNGELEESSFYIPPTFEPSNMEGFYEKHKMHYNIYIPSYGRAGNAPTVDMLERHGITSYYIAVDPSQYPEYKKHYPIDRIIVRDPSFRGTEKLDLVTSIVSPNSMHGTAGVYNSLLYFSKSLGETHYWTMDDDFIGMAMKARKGNESAKAGEKYDKDNYYRCSHILDEYGFSMHKFLADIEELTMKMRNPGFVGLEKFGLVFTLPVMWKNGTRVYSFYLSRNDTQVDHLGQHNNDVVTSLELSKHGMVNMLFEGISYNSKATQLSGGLTEVYQKFGTLDKGKVLVRAQPNYSKINVNYNRIHHTVDYTKYNKQRLVGAPKEE